MPPMRAGATCPFAGQRKAVSRVVWGAVNGQVEQRRSLSLLAHGTARHGRSVVPGTHCQISVRRHASPRSSRKPPTTGTEQDLAMISDNLLTTLQPAGRRLITPAGALPSGLRPQLACIARCLYH